MGLWIKETHVNATGGYQYYQGDWYETDWDTVGELFRAMQKEYGRAESKMYRDGVDGIVIQTGWVFGKEILYDDRPGNKISKYHREVWVEVSIVKLERRMEWKTKPKSPWE
jgi:hypothetical protein